MSVDVGEQRVAVLEDSRVAEVYLERPDRRSIAGNIYLGVVDNVLPGMEAAFVEIGLEKNGFLYVDEIVGPELEGRRGARKSQDLIQRGQTILVQAVKDPMKTKGARLTTEISLPGRFVVYVPHGDGLGVSRRIEDEERNRLKAILKEIAPKQGGVIVRTAAEGASADDIERDLVFLQRLWKSIEAQAKSSKAPALIGTSQWKTSLWRSPMVTVWMPPCDRPDRARWSASAMTRKRFSTKGMMPVKRSISNRLPGS